MTASLYQSGSLAVSLALCAMRLTFDAHKPTRNQPIVPNCWTKSSVQIKTRGSHRALDFVLTPDPYAQIQNNSCCAKETCARYTVAHAIAPSCAAARAWSAK